MKKMTGSFPVSSLVEGDVLVDHQRWRRLVKREQSWGTPGVSPAVEVVLYLDDIR